VQQPLFPGYVFVHVMDQSRTRLEVLKTSGVFGFVGPQGVGVPIPDKEIQDIQTVVDADVPFAAFPFLRIGHRVRIRSGCLDGVEGILMAKNEDQSVVVCVDLIQRALAVRVAGFSLEMI
jgi:transcription antitermination factor NusG